MFEVSYITEGSFSNHLISTAGHYNRSNVYALSILIVCSQKSHNNTGESMCRKNLKGKSTDLVSYGGEFIHRGISELALSLKIFLLMKAQ
jgi:hypothetical protein